MVAKYYKNCVLKITTVFGHLEELANVKIQQAHGIILGRTLEAMLRYFFFRQVIYLKTLVLLGNSKRPVICSCLYVGKERTVLRLTGQHPVNLPEQSQVGNTPNIDQGFRITVFLVQMDSLDTALDERAHIRPAGVATDKIELLMVAEVVQCNPLLGNQRVPGGCFNR